MPDIRKQLRLIYRRIGNCLENCRRNNRVSHTDPEALSKRQEESQQRIAEGFSGQAKRQRDLTDEMIRDLGKDQNPKIAAGGMQFDISFDQPVHKPKPVRNEPRPLVDFTDDEMELMDSIIKAAAKEDTEMVAQEQVIYTAAEKGSLGGAAANGYEESVF